MNYTTLYLVRDYLRLGTAETQDDGLLSDLIVDSTKQIKLFCRRRFDIRREELLFDYPNLPPSRIGRYSAYDFVATMNATASYSQKRLAMDTDLLQLFVLTNGDDTVVDSDDYVLEPARLYPKQDIRLRGSSGVAWMYGDNGSRLQVISVDAYWGYHDEYSEAWVNSLDTLQADINAVETVLSVSDADGVAGDLQFVRFQAGNLIRLVTAELATEFMLVTAVDYGANNLTVARGYAGTSAVAHLAAEQIYLYRISSNIELACTRLVAWRYRQKDSDSFNREIILGTGEVTVPTSMPEDVTRLLPAPKERLSDERTY